MKKLSFIPLAALVLSVFMIGCAKSYRCVDGSGEYQSQVYGVQSFDEVSVHGDAEVYVYQDTFTEVRVEAQRNVLEALNVRVNNGELEIGKDNCFRNSKTIKVYVTTPVLRAADLSGSGTLKTIGRFQASVFRADISGSGEMDLNVVTDNFVGELSGSGKLTLTGIGTEQHYDISGSGDVRAFEFSGKSADIEISGSGNCEVNVSDRLHVDISGSGNVFYKGRPSITTDISGSGNIISK